MMRRVASKDIATMKRRLLCLASVTAFVLTGCATIPNGPAVSIMPGEGKTLAEFQNDDALCRNFASQQVQGLTPDDAAVSSGAKSAIVGTALGAAAGAAFGGGSGAAIGAGAGLLGGSALGAGAAGASANDVQYRYDNAYSQCMTTQGNPPPAPRPMAYAPNQGYAPPAAYGPPPPPPVYGYAYPPPPPAYGYVGYYWH
jgi:hypothetical protein